MKNKISLKVSITGIDGVGKCRAIETTINYLNGYGWKVETELIPVDASKLDFFGFLDRTMEKTWLWAERHGDRFIPTLGYTLSTLLCRPKFLFRFYLLGQRPEILIRHRDPIIDATVYSWFYWRWIEKLFRFDLEAKLRWIKNLTRESWPDILIHLEVDPKVAVMRINQRRLEHKKKKVNHFHEKEEILAELQRLYEKTIELAQKEAAGSMRIFHLDTTNVSPAELGPEISGIILRYLN